MVQDDLNYYLLPNVGKGPYNSTDWQAIQNNLFFRHGECSYMMIEIIWSTFMFALLDFYECCVCLIYMAMTLKGFC